MFEVSQHEKRPKDSSVKWGHTVLQNSKNKVHYYSEKLPIMHTLILIFFWTGVGYFLVLEFGYESWTFFHFSPIFILVISKHTICCCIFFQFWSIVWTKWTKEITGWYQCDRARLISIKISHVIVVV